MCKVLKVSRSGFYAHMRHRHNRSGPEPEQAALEARIKEIFRLSKETYGTRRMVKELEKFGYAVSRYRVRKLCNGQVKTDTGLSSIPASFFLICNRGLIPQG
jgi:hypothetical protein